MYCDCSSCCQFGILLAANTGAYETFVRDCSSQLRRLYRYVRHRLKNASIHFTVTLIYWALVVTVVRTVTIRSDRKCHEFGRCKELNCYPAFFGLSIVLVLDVILLWLHASTTLSWVIPSSSIYRIYFFPVPNIPIRAGETGLAVNVGGILVIWFLVWIKSSLLERLIAKRLLAAQKHRKDLRRQQRREARRLASDAAGSATTTKLTKRKKESHNSDGSGKVHNSVDEHNQLIVSPCSMDNSSIGQMGLKEQQGLQDLLTPSISESAVEVLQAAIHLEPAHRRLQYDYINEEQEQAHSFMDLD